MNNALIVWISFSVASMSILVLCIFHKNTAKRMQIVDWNDVIIVFLLSLLPFVNMVTVFMFLTMHINLKKRLHE